MPPKQRSPSADTQADEKVTKEAKRLRARASPSLLQSKVPHHTTPVPSSLRKSDGADIVKRNANRKKKYLFVFPGALSLPASGGKIGSLTSLDTRTPQLNIHFPSGTLRLLGTLVFPQNAFLSIKPTRSAVQVFDVFETMIVFSEWRWIGDPASNPAGLPVPLPNSVKAPSQQLWLTETPEDISQNDEADGLKISSESESALEEVSDDYLSSAPKIDTSTPARSNPRRKGRVVNYSQLEESASEYNSGEDDEDDEEGDAGADEPQKRRRGRPKKTENEEQTHDVSKPEDALSGRASRRKRRRVDYSAKSDDDIDANGHVDNDEGVDAPRDRLDDREKASQPDVRALQFDDSVELVDTTVQSSRNEKAPMVRRNRRKIVFSQESDDEDVEDVEDDGDGDFAMTVDDGEGSDVVVLD